MTKRNHPDQLDLTGTVENPKTALCVPAIRSSVAEWRKNDYPGATDVTKLLLNYWFETDHIRPDRSPFEYYACQREAIETLIYVWEIAKARKQWDLYGQFRNPAYSIPAVPYDLFARYCVKMATGSGKTTVMALAAVWQYFNAVEYATGISEQYSKTFLIIAPNLIVYERLKKDFGQGEIFKDFPLIPKHFDGLWSVDFMTRDDSPRAIREGLFLLTNIQRLHERENGRISSEPAEMTGVLGAKPREESAGLNIVELLAKRNEQVLVLNDEAHHTHEDASEWNKVIRRLNDDVGVSMQLDFSATPRYSKTGTLFPWTISDFTLKQAIETLPAIVKRPMKGIAHAEELNVKDTVKRYLVFLTAGVERWKEYKEQLAPLNRKPVLFIMMNDTDEAKEVTDWLRNGKYSEFFAGDRTQEIHTELRGENAGEVSKKDLAKARKIVREVDNIDSTINAIVSVLMLREGWDVQSVTVVVGLRPYTAKANILPEQTIGRGLRLMFRGKGYNFIERVDVIGNRAFLDFVAELEKDEEMEFGSFELGKDKLNIVVIRPDMEKKAFDISLPVLTPLLTRRKNLVDEINLLDVMTLPISEPLTVGSSGGGGKEFHFEGIDVVTKTLLVERDYKMDEITNPQEVIGFYTELVASELHLPSHFAVLYPKVRDFFEFRAFGKPVDLFDQKVINAMAEKIAGAVCIKAFKQVLGPIILNRETPELAVPSRLLSTIEPFPWSAPTLKASKCILNLVPCDNEFEKNFAAFLERVRDVRSFSKLPLNFGFSIEYIDDKGNMRHYYPDWVVIDSEGNNWLVETKGQEDVNVIRKDEAATLWCENATKLTGANWEYLRVNQNEMEKSVPNRFADLKKL